MSSNRAKCEISQMRTRSTTPGLQARLLALVTVVVLLLAACGGGSSGSSESSARDALDATGLTDREIDCILDTAGISPEELLDVDSDDGSDLSEAMLDAFSVCVDAEGDDSAEPNDTDAAETDDTADEEALRTQIIAAGLTEAELDCILETTDFELADLVELETTLGSVGGEEMTPEREAALLACFDTGGEIGGETNGADEPGQSTTFEGDCAQVNGPCTYGDDPALDVLWDDCDAGSGAACDALFFDSPSGSEYEHFGDTCGGRGQQESCEAADAG